MAKLYIKNTDGTFAPHSSIAVTKLDVVQSKGNSLTSAMSQKAVTDEFGTIQDAIANIVNAGYVFAGVATPATDPSTPNAKVFYIAKGKGTYEKFGGIEVTEDEVVVLKYDTAWHKVATGIASEEKLTELDSKLNIAKNTGYFDDKIINQRAVSKKIDDLSMAIGVTEITLTADDFSDMIWNGSSILKSNANYNSFIIKVPSSVKVSYSATYLSNQSLFNEAPILNKSYTEKRFFSGGTIPEGYIYLLINVDLAKYDNSPLVVTIENNGLRKELSDNIERVATFDERINNVEEVKNIVGAYENIINLTASDYSGLVYNGTKFVVGGTAYNSFILPLHAGLTTQIINNTELSYADAGFTTAFTFNIAPALGEMEYVRKGNVDFSINSFEPLDNEKYICININLSKYSDNNFSFKTDSYGLVKRVDNLENSLNILKGKTILCLGDSITELMYNNKKYSDYIAEITQANVINGGIGGTQMGRRLSLPSDLTFSSNSKAYAALDLPSITHALNTGDFTTQEAAAQWLISDSNPEKTTDDNTAIIETLKNVNLSNVDIVTIFIGTNDYNSALGEIGEIGDDTSLLNMAQGFHQIIKHLLTANPNLRIYYFSPMPRYFADIRTFDPNNAASDSNWCDNVVGAKGFKFPDMVDHQIKLAQYYKIPACDMYRTMGINQWNIASIMRGDIADGTHPYKGLKMLANKIVSFIEANNNLNM